MILGPITPASAIFRVLPRNVELHCSIDVRCPPYGSFRWQRHANGSRFRWPISAIWGTRAEFCIWSIVWFRHCRIVSECLRFWKNSMSPLFIVFISLRYYGKQIIGCTSFSSSPEIFSLAGLDLFEFCLFFRFVIRGARPVQSVLRVFLAHS